jgi:hypothetical protein
MRKMNDFTSHSWHMFACAAEPGAAMTAKPSRANAGLMFACLAEPGEAMTANPSRTNLERTEGEVAPSVIIWRPAAWRTPWCWCECIGTRFEGPKLGVSRPSWLPKLMVHGVGAVLVGGHPDDGAVTRLGRAQTFPRISLSRAGTQLVSSGVTLRVWSLYAAGAQPAIQLVSSGVTLRAWSLGAAG